MNYWCKWELLLSRRSWVRIPLKPQIVFWAFFATAWVASQLWDPFHLCECIKSPCFKDTTFNILLDAPLLWSWFLSTHKNSIWSSTAIDIGPDPILRAQVHPDHPRFVGPWDWNKETNHFIFAISCEISCEKKFIKQPPWLNFTWLQSSIRIGTQWVHVYKAG